MILLDTCAFLWLAAQQESLSSAAKKKIIANAGNIYVSSISAFEIGVKSKKNLLILPYEASEWYRDALGLHGLKSLSVTDEIAMLSSQLPEIHLDPADRIIVATAIHHHCTILTPDKHIRDYDVKVVW
jgi:PIN domain nuclease of toxin-antitoxin system